MKYNRFQQIISVTMALLLLISTLSFSIEKHYCGENLVDIAIVFEADKCGMEGTDQAETPSEQSPALQQNSCCKDVVNWVEGQKELSLEKTKVLNAHQKVFVLSFAFVFNEIYSPKSENTSFFKPPAPLHAVKDIQLLNQVFLI